MSNLTQFLQEYRPFNMVAANAVTSGDLIVTLNGGEAVSAGANQALSRLNRDNSASAASLLNTSGTAVGYPGSTNVGNVTSMRPARTAVLSNNTIVEMFMGDGTTNDTGVYYIIRTVAGATIVPRTQLSAGTSATFFMCAALVGGGFAYCYSTASDLTAKYGIISNTGAVVLAATALITGGNTVTGTNAWRYWTMSRLTGGGFAIAGQTIGGTPTLLSWVFNASGVLQGAQTTLFSGTVNSGFIVSLGASNGDFVVFGDDQGTLPGGRLWRYTSAGVIVGSVQTPFSTSSPNYSSYITGVGRLAELVGGNIVVLGGAANASAQVRAYTTSNAAVGAAVTWGASASSTNTELQGGGGVLVPVSTGGFVIFFQFNSNIFYLVFSSSAALLYTGQVSGLTSTVSASSYSQLFIQGIGAAGFVVLIFSLAPGTPTYSIDVGIVSTDFAIVGSRLNLYTGSTLPGAVTGVLSSDFLSMGVTWNVGAAPNYAAVATVGCSITGVATSGAAAGAQFVANTVGTYTYNQALAGQSLSFDRRSSTPFGNRGTIIGQTALLFGIQQAS